MFFHFVLVLPKNDHVLVFVFFTCVKNHTVLLNESGFHFGKLWFHHDILKSAHDLIEE